MSDGWANTGWQNASAGRTEDSGGQGGTQWEGDKIVSVGGVTVASGERVIQTSATSRTYRDDAGNIHYQTDPTGRFNIGEGSQMHDVVVGGFQGGYSGSGFQRMAATELSSPIVQRASEQNTMIAVAGATAVEAGLVSGYKVSSLNQADQFFLTPGLANRYVDSFNKSSPTPPIQPLQSSPSIDLYHQAGFGVLTPQTYAERYGLPFAKQAATIGKNAPNITEAYRTGLTGNITEKQRGSIGIDVTKLALYDTKMKVGEYTEKYQKGVYDWAGIAETPDFLKGSIAFQELHGFGRNILSGVGTAPQFAVDVAIGSEMFLKQPVESAKAVPIGLGLMAGGIVKEPTKSAGEFLGFTIATMGLGLGKSAIKYGSVNVGTIPTKNLPFESSEFFHGTPTENVANIMKEGIRPNIPEGAKVWSGQKPYESVYLTKNYETAMKYATNAGQNTGAILKVELSSEQMGNIRYLGEKMAGWELKGSVAPEQINVYKPTSTLWHGIYTDIKTPRPIVGLGQTLKSWKSGFSIVTPEEHLMIDLEASSTPNVKYGDVARNIGINAKEIEIPKPNIIVGTPKPEQLPELNIGKTEIVTGIEKTILTNPKVMEKYGYFTPQEVAKANLGEVLLSKVKNIKSIYTEKELPTETKATSPIGIEVAKDYFVGHENQLKQIYGSYSAYNQLNPEYRVGGTKEMISLPSDIDVQLGEGKFSPTPVEAFKIAFGKADVKSETINLEATESGKYAQGLLTKLKEVDEPVAIEPEKPALIITTKEGLPSHAFDIHAGDIQQAGEVAPEGIFGFKYGQSSIKMSNVPTMKLSEQAMRKIGSTLTLQSFTKSQLEKAGLYSAFKEMYGEKEIYKGFFPELHRMKDIAHITPIGYSLAESTLISESKIKTVTDKYVAQYGKLADIGKIQPESPSLPQPSAYDNPLYAAARIAASTILGSTQASKKITDDLKDTVKEFDIKSKAKGAKVNDDAKFYSKLGNSPEKMMEDYSKEQSKGMASGAIYKETTSNPSLITTPSPYFVSKPERSIGGDSLSVPSSIGSPSDNISKYSYTLSPPKSPSKGGSPSGGSSIGKPYVPEYPYPALRSQPKYYSPYVDVSSSNKSPKINIPYFGEKYRGAKVQKDTDFFFGFRESPIMPVFGKQQKSKAGLYKGTSKERKTDIDLRKLSGIK